MKVTINNEARYTAIFVNSALIVLGIVAAFAALAVGGKFLFERISTEAGFIGFMAFLGGLVFFCHHRFDRNYSRWKSAWLAAVKGAGILAGGLCLLRFGTFMTGLLGPWGLLPVAGAVVAVFVACIYAKEAFEKIAKEQTDGKPGA